MPVATQEVVAGWVSCMDARCPGYTQKPADVVRETVAFSYIDLGALPSDPIASVSGAVERETVRIVQEDAECEHCGRQLLFTDQARPEYPQVSGQDDMALFNLNQSGQIRDEQVKGLERDKELANMRATMAEMRELMSAQQVELERRRGGRPRKSEDE